VLHTLPQAVLVQLLNEDALKKGALQGKGMDRTIAAAAKAAVKVLAEHQCAAHTHTALSLVIRAPLHILTSCDVHCLALRLVVHSL
jgi:hypothetical protein